MTPKYTRTCALSLGLVTLISINAYADTTVYQKGKVFSEENVTLKTGEKLLFVNDDSVSHNVYANIKGKKEDLGLQKPGEEGALTFDEPGKYRVRCAIHPKMKLTVAVE